MALFSLGNTSRLTFDIAGTEFLVAELTAREKISAIFEVDLTLATEDAILFEDVIGKTALLGIESTDATRFFHGIVNRFIQTGMQGRFFMYQARIVPQIWLLTLEQDCRIFQNKNVPDIVKQILEDSSITSDIFDFRLQGTYQPREYCVQYRETDLAFISRLLEEEGIFYFFEHKSDRHILVFGDGTGCYKPIEGDDNVIFKPKSAMVSDREAVFNFLLKREICSGKYTLQDFNYAKPDLDLTSEKVDKENKSYEVYDYPGEYTTPEEGKRLANTRLEEALVYKFKAEGDSVCPRFSAGLTFHLSDHDISGFNRSYLIYEVTHTGSQPQVLQEHATDDSGSRYSNLFYAVPSDITYRPQRKTHRPVVEGVQTAIVTGPSGEEIYTDKYGRVKVQFHWDRLGKKDDKSSCWIRVSQPAAGSGWGAVDIPRIGHEVIVDFVEGDPDQPIITGRVYHGTNLPPYTLPDNKMVHGMKSNTTPGGGGFNEISMNDTQGKELLTIHAQKDMNAKIENNMSTSVGAARSLSVGDTDTVTITKDSSVTVTEGNYTHDVKTGKATFHVTGDVQQDYDATQKTTVNSDLDIQSKTSHAHITAATDIHLKVGASELLMKSDGSIKLKGVDLAIDGVTVSIHGVTVTSKADTVHSSEGVTVTIDGKATTIIKGGMLMLNP